MGTADHLMLLRLFTMGSQKLCERVLELMDSFAQKCEHATELMGFFAATHSFGVAINTWVWPTGGEGVGEELLDNEKDVVKNDNDN